MHKIITTTAIAALMASSALPAFAQDANAGAGVGVDAGAGVSVETPAVDANAGANADADVDATAATTGQADNTYGSLMASIKANADVDLTTVTDESKVTIVLLSSLQGNAATEAAALDNELEANADAHSQLHSNIDGNAAIKAKLEAEGYASTDVVAVKANADGSVIVYVDDRA